MSIGFKVISTMLTPLLLLASLVFFGSINLTNAGGDGANTTLDSNRSAGLAPSEGPISNLRNVPNYTEPKVSPGFEVLVTLFILVALSAIKIGIK